MKTILLAVCAVAAHVACALEVIVRDFRTVKDGKCVLFNIGTAAHGPSSVAEVMRFLPGAKVTFWADAPLSEELASMMARRFPQMEIVWGSLTQNGGANPALVAAVERADALIVASSSGVSGGVRRAARDFRKLYPGKKLGALAMGTPCEDMKNFDFAFFRDELAYAKGCEKGWLAPVHGYAPDSVFHFDAVDEKGAEKFMAAHGLEPGRFVCAIPGNRYTPRWEFWPNMKPNEKYIAVNEKYLESDHAPLRAAITESVRRHGVRVLICAEQRTELKLIKSAVYDKLPEDVKSGCVCQQEMWGADLALGVYRQSRLVYGIEMHSQVMALGSGVPAVLFHHPGFGTKADMWRTVGVPEWRVDLLKRDASEQAVAVVGGILADPAASAAKAAKARAFIDKTAQEMFDRAFADRGSCAPSGNGAVTINPADAVIVAPKSAKAAAEELKLHLKLITGVEVPIVKKAPEGAYAFRLAPSQIAPNSEACEWKVTPAGTTFGGNVRFAVLDFLEEGLGVRWPEEDFVSYKPVKELKLEKLSGFWAPEIKIRTIRMGKKRHPEAANAARVFVSRMREGRHDAPVYGHAFTQYWKLYGKDHPEYFGMRKDGVRAPKNVKTEDLKDNIAVYGINIGTTLGMCVTSTGLVAQIVENWKQAGAGEYINLCENDIPGQDSCHCAPCRALDVVPEKFDAKWETYYADRYVRFGNNVLEEARKIRPDVKVCYYAYNATQDAPARERPDPAVVAGIVPTYFSEDYISRYVGAWKKAGLKNFFYRPNRHYYFDCPYLPLGGEEHFLKILHYLHRQGAIGFDYDAPQASPKGFQWFERYVLNHAMQDPSKPLSYWENHYCSAFGAAADDVKAYYRYWREEVWNKRLGPNLEELANTGKYFNFGRGLLWNLGKYYKAEDFAAAEKHLAAAEAKELFPAARELVGRLRVRHDHAKVFFEAVAHKSKANTEKLVAYRKAHGYPLYTWSEQYYGDITGVEGLLGPEKKDKSK